MAERFEYIDNDYNSPKITMSGVVEGDGPDVAISNRENLLGEDEKEGNKKGSQDAIDDTSKRKAFRNIFLINSKKEIYHNSSTACNSTR